MGTKESPAPFSAYSGYGAGEKSWEDTMTAAVQPGLLLQRL